MPGNSPGAPGKGGGSAAGLSPGQNNRNQSYWFHILSRNTPEARNLHAAKLAEKAWLQGDRVGITCDSMEQAVELDELLWSFSPDSFIPHTVVSDGISGTSDPVGILTGAPAPADWDTVIVLASSLPPDAGSFKRLALVAHNDPATLNMARSHFRELRALGIEPRVHDQRKR